jgi:GAF domain-containing protein
VAGEKHDDVAGEKHDDEVRQAVGSGGQGSSAGVARELSRLSREMQADMTTAALLSRIVAAAVTEVPGAGHAGITLVSHGEVSTPAASDDLAAEVDRLQRETGEGPCIDSARQHVTVRADDLRAEARWPEFARRAAELGVRSVLSFQLFVEAESFGALNVYAGAAGAFGPESESTGMLLASHAAIAMTAERTRAQLRIGLDSRDVIGQAKGILMERYKITGTQAFALIVASSQAVNQKLWVVADHLATTGELPAP